MVRDGVWGTSPLALVRVLKEQGFRVGTAVGEPSASALLKNYDSLLLTLYNNGNDIRDQIHTVCVTAEGAREAFCIHNAAGCGPVYAEGVYTMQELTAAIPGGRAKLILAVGAGPAACAADSR